MKKLSIGLKSWHFICLQCHYEGSNLETKINEKSLDNTIDENSRKSGLRDLRILNFKKLLLKIKSLVSFQTKLLDVGSAHGWFLNEAQNDFNVCGIEPDRSMFEKVLSIGLPVRFGYFPQVLEKNEKFDIIVFNDVIEHIPDVNNILDSCRKHLNINGLLVLNLPNTNGIFYIISKILCKCGFYGMFERLWQKDYPSPHLHYFNKRNLVKLLTKKKFVIRSKGSLRTLLYSEIYNRISHTNDLSLITASIIYLGVLIFLPLLKVMPPDIIYIISEKK
jgi:2-polyprenyl-3-methyl-5-hydroxy-6-metoxy-1,4-benzoquinol methylase